MKKNSEKHILGLLLALAIAIPFGANAQESEAQGVNFDLGFSTVYVFRGINVFQETSQMDQNMMLAPGITWEIPDTNFTLGYWGGFQISGDNVSANLNGALAAEQNLFVTYDLTLHNDIGLSLGAIYYFYPWSTNSGVGSSWASYIEPTVGLSYSCLADFGLDIAYFLGLQDEPGIFDISYLYIHPHMEKAFELTSKVALELGLEYGFKWFKEGNSGAANVHHLALMSGFPISLNNGFYVKPGLNVAWTNIPGQDFKDELVLWGGLNLGTDF